MLSGWHGALETTVTARWIWAAPVSINVRLRWMESSTDGFHGDGHRKDVCLLQQCRKKKNPVDVFLVPLVLRWYMLFFPVSNNQWVFLSSVEYRSALHCCSWQNRLYEKMMISLAFKVRQFTLSTPLICVIYLLLTLVVKGRNTEAGVPALLVLCLEGWGRPAKAGI